MLLIWEKAEKFLCEKWIPFGFGFFLTCVFWAPREHYYKVILPYCLLLPALILLLDWRFRPRQAARSPVLMISTGYLVYMSLTAIVLRGSAGLEFSKWSLYIFLFLIGLGLHMRISERALARLLLWGALMAASAGLYAAGRDIASKALWQPDYRMVGYGPLYNALRTGFLFGAFSVVSAWYALNREFARWSRILAVVVALTCLVSTVLTDSRAPLLALFITAAVATAINRRWVYLALVVGITATVLLDFWPRLSDRGLSLRPEVWQYAWEQCLQYPWFGAGLNRYPLPIPTSLGIVYNTHNIFLAVFLQGGVFGLLLFFAMNSASIYLSLKDRKFSRIASLAASLQLYSIIALQFDGVSLITRPADTWVLLWLPTALHLYAHAKAPRRVLSEKAVERPQCAA